jgi:hypothetical protein
LLGYQELNAIYRNRPSQNDLLISSATPSSAVQATLRAQRRAEMQLENFRQIYRTA